MFKKIHMNMAIVSSLVVLLALLACTHENESGTTPTQNEPIVELTTTEHPHPAPEYPWYTLKCAIGVEDEDASYQSFYPGDAGYQDIVQETLADMNDELRNTTNRQFEDEIRSYIDQLEGCVPPYPEDSRYSPKCAIVAMYEDSTFGDVLYPESSDYRGIVQEMLAGMNDGLRNTVNNQSAEDIQSDIDYLEGCLVS